MHRLLALALLLTAVGAVASVLHARRARARVELARELPGEEGPEAEG
jgi:hypothetical protein